MDEQQTNQEAPMHAYTRDDYPREGCTAAVDVTKRGFGLAVFDPKGNQIESYAPTRTPDGVARMLRDWCEGRAPRPPHKADHS